MAASNVLKPGDKIDISLLAVENKDENNGARKVYKSQIMDMKKNGNLLILMPLEEGKLILLPLGVRFQFEFYTQSGIFGCVGVIVSRYKTDNIYTLEVEMKTILEKIQRREYYRYPLVADMEYYFIEDDEARPELVETVLETLKASKSSEDISYAGTIVDISGGGIRFRADRFMKTDQKLCLDICIKNSDNDNHFHLIASVVSCYRKDQDVRNGWEIRASFIINDDKIREEIVHFIFEEERKARKKDRL